VNPEEWHDGQSGAEEGWAYRTFYPSIPLLRDLARELGRDEAPLFSPDIINDAGLACALALAHASATPEDLMGAETSMLIALRHLIFNHRTCSNLPEQIASTRSWESAFASHLDLQSLARAAGVTRFQVIRDFKKVTGVTPGTFIRNGKLRRACFLIEQGSSLADAALEAGFADQSHLSRGFRAAHGITPAIFKKVG
jgi:AraC-like DNA-binding protein